MEIKEFDSRAFRNACGTFTTGVTVITSKNEDGTVHGMTANGFISVSLEPPLIAVSIGNNQKMFETIKNSGIYGVSILKDDHKDHCSHFAGKHNPELNIDFVEYDGVPVLKNALAHFVTKVHSSHLAGDHTLFVGEVLDFYSEEDGNPILFHRGQFRELK